MEGNKFYAIAVVVCPVDGEMLMDETYMLENGKPGCNVCGREMTMKKTLMNMDTPYESMGTYYEVVTDERGKAFMENNPHEDGKGIFALTAQLHSFEVGSIVVL